MSIGTSIFFSVVLLSLVLLFISTKDRWKWKKILLFSIGVPLTICLLIGAGYWAYLTISDRPHIQDTFWDIPISASKSDVKFLKGEPAKITDDAGKELWEYGSEHIYGIRFKGDKIVHITYMYRGEKDWAAWPWIQGVQYGDTYNSIIKKFGPPSNISILKNDLERILSFKKYVVFFVLEKDKVYAYGVYDRTSGQVQFTEEKENKKK